MEVNISNRKTRWIFTGALLAFVMLVLIFYSFSAPSQFPVGQRVKIGQGMNVHQISVLLEQEKVIRNPILFNLYLRLSGESKSLNAGTYIFEEKFSMFTVARRIVDGVHNIPSVTLFIPEGSTVEFIANRSEDVLVNFDKEKFIRIASKHEGKLFPDTYFISDETTEEELLNILVKNFEKNMDKIKSSLATSEFTLDEIIILASIIEKEVGNPEDRRLVSSVLQNRLSINMALQVDATLDYVLGKNTYELTFKDLEYDSPFNTYKYIGLPPAPIGSPGLDSILSVLEPAESDYLFYVSDREGNTYFSKTFKEHQANVAKYL